jgi:hypothetical protein
MNSGAIYIYTKYLYIAYAEQLCLLRIAPSRAQDPTDRLIGRVKSMTDPNQIECITKTEIPGPRSPLTALSLPITLLFANPEIMDRVRCIADRRTAMPHDPVHPSRLPMHPPRHFLSLYLLSLTRQRRVVTANH